MTTNAAAQNPSRRERRRRLLRRVVIGSRRRIAREAGILDARAEYEDEIRIGTQFLVRAGDREGRSTAMRNTTDRSTAAATYLRGRFRGRIRRESSGRPGTARARSVASMAPAIAAPATRKNASPNAGPSTAGASTSSTSWPNSTRSAIASSWARRTAGVGSWPMAVRVQEGRAREGTDAHSSGAKRSASCSSTLRSGKTGACAGHSAMSPSMKRRISATAAGEYAHSASS